MAKTMPLISTVIAAAVVVFSVVTLHVGERSDVVVTPESAFERVMRTRTIRCAYGVWPPRFRIDPNTKEKSGIDFDVMEAIGRVANLKISWDEEVSLSQMPEQLQSGKQDAVCTAVWENASRAQRVEMSRAFDYMPLYAYVRCDDNRFDHDISRLNNDKFSLAIIDGGAQEALAVGSFPLARKYSLPQSADASQSLLAVATRKADVVFADAAVIADYNAHNSSQKLKRVSGAGPLRVYGDVFTVAKGETELRDLISAALTELLNDGTISRILARYENEPGAFLRVTSLYQEKAVP